jgi:queuine tRNA-ribosyltransferase
MTNGFSLLKECPNSRARVGELTTGHGKVATPIFLPVGSQATVKTLTPEEIKRLGFDMVLVNAYHLYLRPGVSVIKELGGLHRFMGWDKAILTDSGGYQIFSLAPLSRITDDGVTFSSHIDGSRHHITPELAVEYQEALGADIIMALDECPPSDASPSKIKATLERTSRWAERCLKAKKDNNQALYSIIQGGVSSKLRKRSAESLTSLDFPGYAIGGLSLGETKEVTMAVVEETTALLPPEKPCYLMGVGSPEDIVNAVARGVDIFDSVLPARIARNGSLFTGRGRINITNAIYKRVEEPVDPECGCYSCLNFSAAYLNHLFRSKELLAYRLATFHNLYFISKLMQEIRKTVSDGSFASFMTDFLNNYQPTDEHTRREQKQRWLRRNRDGRIV